MALRSPGATAPQRQLGIPCQLTIRTTSKPPPSCQEYSVNPTCGSTELCWPWERNTTHRHALHSSYQGLAHSSHPRAEVCEIAETPRSFPIERRDLFDIGSGWTNHVESANDQGLDLGGRTFVFLPEKKAPLPVRTMARTALSREASDKWCKKTLMSSWERALRLASLLKARTRTPSAGVVARTNSSAMMSDSAWSCAASLSAELAMYWAGIRTALLANICTIS